jgi:uncharacterized damage-inducible protein DinB
MSETTTPHDQPLRKQLVSLMTEANAHATFDQAIENLPAKLRGQRPEGLPHSPWELLEHLRLAQWDILDFSRNPKYEEKKWPEDYWPKSPEPPSAEAWDDSIAAFHRDLKEMCDLVEDPATDLFAKIPHGSGQTILREALLVADHNAYHVGQIVLVRQLLGAWR